MTSFDASRRRLLAAATLSAAPALSPALAQPLIASTSAPLMPRGKKRRVVVLGGGWGGLSVARHLREQAPDLEVVLIERNPLFWSCPLSNKWLIDVVDTSFLVHSYTAPAARWGYAFVQTEVTDIDRDRRRVHTAQGWLDYDWLVVSAGIRVAYEPWFGDDPRAIAQVRERFASAYVPSAEHLALKKKLHAFRGGTIVMTLPPPPHRCPPSPYERACLMAARFKREKVPARIVILDPKPRIAPITIGYREAFEEFYPDIVTHVPNAAVRSVDPFGRTISTTAGDFAFDDAILMGHHQAADLVWKLGAIGKGADGRPTGWAAVDPRLYHLPDDPRTYVIGDSVGAVSPHFGHYPKSGHVANRMGRSVAKHIAQQARGEAPTPEIIENLCYMLVNTAPLEAISVQFDYSVGADGHLAQKQLDDNARRRQLWEEDLVWYGLMAREMIGD